MSEVDFAVFKKAVKEQFDRITTDPTRVYRMGISKDDIWEAYMNGFPEGTNEIFRERREYDCVYCKQFIRRIGNVVAIGEDFGLISVWDVDVPSPFKEVAAACSAAVKASGIANVFLHDEKSAGVDFNRAEIDGEIVKFNHFHVNIQPTLVNTRDRDSKLGETRSSYDVLKRAMIELKPSALEMVVELVEQNSLYKGQEFLPVVARFKFLQYVYNQVTPEHQDACLWVMVNVESPALLRIRNSAIGTLLINLSDDMELDDAVRKYEAVVAPTNYKRPTALVTKAMIKRAEQTVEELGYMESLQRRYAVTEDITVNNVLFADRSAKKLMKNAFEELAETTSDNVNPKHLEKVEEVTIDMFVQNILPKAESIEVLVENSHEQNFVTLLSPVNKDAKCMLKWPNNFSWSYAGEVTDSIKDRVKAAGGSVSGDLRCSLAWHNADDLDIHLKLPSGGTIYYGNEMDHSSGGNLDVDMNAGGRTNEIDPVENITFPHKRDMAEGAYKLYIKQFSKRTTDRVGFTAQIEFDGKMYEFTYDKSMKQKEDVVVATFKYTHAKGLELMSSLPEAKASKEVWSINTQQYVKCRMIMNSPNHWDDNQIGNKHLFFVLEGCKSPGKTRGFYNEFLTEELRDHRKVFEMLGSKMKAEESDDQLSGLGFSTTRKNHVFCKVQGAFNRTVKVTF